MGFEREFKILRHAVKKSVPYDPTAWRDWLWFQRDYQRRKELKNRHPFIAVKRKKLNEDVIDV